MKIEIGKTYRDGWGNQHRVAGLTKVNAKWAWTIGGEWFRLSDGRKITYTDSQGHHPIPKATWHDLVVVDDSPLHVALKNADMLIKWVDEGAAVKTQVLEEISRVFLRAAREADAKDIKHPRIVAVAKRLQALVKDMVKGATK